MSRRWRHLRHRTTPELNITAFMNLMVILVPFLLITAVFSRVAILELNLPTSATSTEMAETQDLALEVVLRGDAIEVADRHGGLIRRLENRAGVYDLAALADLLQQIKGRFPDKVDATILLEPDIPYDTLVQVMDTVRVVPAAVDGTVAQAELFPQISIGDAPGPVTVAAAP